MAALCATSQMKPPLSCRKALNTAGPTRDRIEIYAVWYVAHLALLRIVGVEVTAITPPSLNALRFGDL
jgi:hypothetical protein